MADRNNADSRHGLTVDPPQHQISKDMQGSENPLPLSPQWLLPKPGDNKPGVVSGEISPHHANRPDSGKPLGNGEDLHNTGKRKDVFRPSLHDADTGRRDRWRDEERETNSTIRRDRWREGDKDFGDTRRIERWSDSSSRQSAEVRRAPSERWTDSGNREGNYDQRRESKWNTRWGPDDKETESWREKWLENGRDGEGPRDKGMPHVTSHGKDINNHGKDTEREDNYSRSWRSNYSISRGRGEHSHHQSQTPNKQSTMFGYGRGRTENGMPASPGGRGRFNSSMSNVNSGGARPYHLGSVTDKSDGAYGEPSALRYSRMKLLDIYRMTDIKNYRISLDGFIEVPTLTLSDPLEPLALSAPTSEELAILKGIDKGDIVSSGLPQVSKDGSVGRISMDTVASKQTKIGGVEDLTMSKDDFREDDSDANKVENFSSLGSSAYERQLRQHGPDPKGESNQNLYSFQENTLNVKDSERILPKADEAAMREVSRLESSSSHYVAPRRSQSVGDHSYESSLDWKEVSFEVGSRTSEMNWPHLQKDRESEHKNNDADTSSFYRDEMNWQNAKGFGFPLEMKNDPIIKRQSSDILDRESRMNFMLGQEDPLGSRDILARKLQSIPPEDLSLHYKDPQGQIQGPFSGSDLIGWFEAGYFGIDLQVRIASAPPDAPFSLLGDVMPHLRMKARPPPGFGAAKHSNGTDSSLRGKSVSSGDIHVGPGEFEIFKNGQKSRPDAATEAQNRFFESLMSGNVSNSLTQGVQEYGGSISGSIQSMGGESGHDMNFLLAQRRLLEKQRSLPNHGSFWSGREVPSMAPNIDMSLLHAAKDKSPSPAVNSGVPMWSNFSEARPLSSALHGAMEIQDKLDIHHNQLVPPQIGFGIQQQRLQPQNQPPMSHLIGQLGDLPPGMILPEQLLASDVSQDPQLLSLLQQQYLLSQLQLNSQASSPTQLSLVDKILLLKQQQQKQEQQQLLLQQQHLLSQVLSGQHSHQHFGDPSYGQAHAAMSSGNAPVDHFGLQRTHEALQINQQLPVLNLHEVKPSYVANMNVQTTQDVNCSVSLGPSTLHLPHQIFDQPNHSKELNASLPQEVVNISNPDSVAMPVMANILSIPEAMGKHGQDDLLQKSGENLDDGDSRHEPQSVSQTTELMVSAGLESLNNTELSKDSTRPEDLSSFSVQINDVKISSENIPEHSQTESFMKEAKSVEVREPKKGSEKKSKKQKNSKAQSTSDHGKGSSRTPSSQQSKPDLEIEGTHAGGTKMDILTNTEESLHGISTGVVGEKSRIPSSELTDAHRPHISSSTNILVDDTNIVTREAESGEDGSLASNAQTTSTHRAWKPAPGLKPKSLLEIQQEEQLRAQRETVVAETASMVVPVSSPLPTPRSVVANLESKSSRDIVQRTNTNAISGNSENSLNSNSRKSQLHDLLAEEVLAKLNEVQMDVLVNDMKASDMPPPSQLGAQADASAVDDDDFVEAKDSKKSRKKASKAKGTGMKAPSPVGSVDLSAPVMPIEKTKSARQMQPERDLLTAPTGPSLGDFVPWKGDQVNAAPAPAWSTDSGKLLKPASLREIQREQERRSASAQLQIPVPTPAKVQPSRSNRGSGSSWPVPGSSPSKAASPIQTSSHVSVPSKSISEDDLFWGPLEQSKPETKQSDFPSLVNSSSWGAKGTSVKGVSGVAASRQKLSSSRSVESSPSTGVSFSKGRKDSVSKQSDAVDFREWCESEWVRLTGTDDTSFLEFCVKQSTSEAEMLLRENLGSLDRNHEFIDKFLNYKELLSSDVIEMAFQAQSTRMSAVHGAGHGNFGTAAINDTDADMEARGGAKKKGKKGKKVSPSVLGFNVVSNRIMMGEIQSIED